MPDRHDGDLPPLTHDLDAEAAVLGCVLDGSHPFSAVSQLLDSRHFYADSHRWIWSALERIDGQPFDLTMLASELHGLERLQQVGGMSYLLQLSEQPAVVDPAHHAATVREHWARRQLWLAATEARSLAGTQDASSTAARLHDALEALGTGPSARTRLSTRDVFAQVEPTRWISQPLDLCRPAPPAIIGGYAFSGKTAISQSLELSVALGRPIWGSFSCRRARVLHADWEQGERLSRKRFQRLAVGMQLDPSELFDGDWLQYELLGPYLTEHNAERYWTRASEGRDLLVLDSLRALAPGLDENSSEFRKVLDMGFRASERTGCLWMFLVHSKKPTQNDSDDGRMKLRGTSAIFDAASSVLLLELNSRDKSVRVTHEKAREGGHPADPFRIRFADIDEGDDQYAGLLVTAEQEKSAEERRAATADACDQRVLAGVLANPWLSVRQLSSVLGMHRGNTVQPALDRLEIKRKVRWKPGPKRATLWGPCDEADPAE